MDAAVLRNVFETVLPRATIEEAARRLGVQERRRAMDPIALIFSLVLMGGTSECGRLAAAVRDYFDRGGQRVVAGAYYKWFDAELLELMRELSANSLAYVGRLPKHLPGILADRVDWRVVDSTVVRLRDELAAVWPGTGEYAALKVHKIYSLGVENVVAYHITPGRRHDAPELKIDESWRGMGLIADLGYAGFDLFRACLANDVQFVLRLKEKWNVYVDDSVGPEGKAGWVGVSEEQKHAKSELEMSGRGLLDVDVVVGPESDPIRMRLVGVPMEKEYGLFLTNVPRATHSADEVGMLYRLRWTIEIDNKLSKSGCQLDEITAERPVSAEILVHAAMLASILANAIAHLDAAEQGAVGSKTVLLRRPPIHPLILWKCIITAAPRIAEMLAAGPAASPTDWARTAANLIAGGQDRNWKQKPSPMDRVKGRTANGHAWRSPSRRNAANELAHAK